MSRDAGLALLGLPVDVGGVRLGTVVAVWLDGEGSPVGVEIAGGWEGDTRFVPLPAVSLGNDVLRTSPFAVLSATEASFYERNGASGSRSTPGTLGFGPPVKGYEVSAA